MRYQTRQWIIILFLAAGGSLALLFYWGQISETPAEVVAEPAPPPPERIRLPEPLPPIEWPDADTVGRPGLVPLPALDESDEYL